MKKHLEQEHPSEEQWMEYLYNEMAPPEQKELERHLEQCALCRRKGESFRGTQASLDRWQVEVPAKHRLAGNRPPAWKWAAAAVLLVSTAFATGRMSRAQVDLAALEAKIAGPIEARVQQQTAVTAERALAAAEQKLRAQFEAAGVKTLAEAAAETRKQIEELAAELSKLHEQDKMALAATLDEYENQRVADYVKFRTDLERVALFSQSVAQFASYSDPEAATVENEPEN